RAGHETEWRGAIHASSGLRVGRHRKTKAAGVTAEGLPRAYKGREDEPDVVAESRSAFEVMLSEAFVGRLFCSSCTAALTSTSSCSELSPFLKFLSACPRLLPSCGSFEGPKKSKASTSTTMISPIPSLIASSGASRRATRIRRRRGSVLPTPPGKPCAIANAG